MMTLTNDKHAPIKYNLLHVRFGSIGIHTIYMAIGGPNKEENTQNVVWIMMVIEEGSIRAWSRWTIHQKRARRRLGVEVPAVMEKGQVNAWVKDINHAI
jgi:hypothetical protein